MRGTLLVKLLNDLRIEIGGSLNPAHNVSVRETHVGLLQRHQERLWEEFAWPHLRVRRLCKINKGQRYYDTPDGVVIDRVETIERFENGRWQTLHPEIGDHFYTIWNSDLDQRTWPVQAWRISEDEGYELWPIPDRDSNPTTLEGMLRVTGIRNLKPLVDDADRCELDDRLIVLRTAAEILVREKSADAQLKVDEAGRQFAKLRSGLTPKRRTTLLGVGETPHRGRMVGTWPIRQT